MRAFSALAVASTAALTLPTGAAFADVVVPSTVYAAGANDALFQSDVRVFNPTASPVNFTAIFYSSTGTTSTSPLLTIPGRSQLAFDNILQTLFGQGPGVFGPVRFETSAPLIVSSGVNNVRACSGGGSGQWLPGIDSASALSAGTLVQLASSVDASSGSRTNVGFMNPGTTPANVTLKARRGDGTIASFATLDPLPPNGFKQVNNWADLPGVAGTADTNLWVEFTSDQPVLAFASVINNVSGDPFAIVATAEPGPPAVTGVASLNAATGVINIVGGGATSVSTAAAGGATTITVSTPAGASLPAGTTGQTLRFNGTALAATSALTNDGTNVGISGSLTLGGSLSVVHPFVVSASGSRVLTSTDNSVFVGRNTGAAVTATNTSSAALGVDALKSLTTGTFNVAVGTSALGKVTGGSQNTASGAGALEALTTGSNNVAFGVGAFRNLLSGNVNTAIGPFAGQALTSGEANVYIRSFGPATNGPESNTTRIGAEQTRTFITGIRGVTTGSTGAVSVFIDGNGQLGTASSSRRLKDDIVDMGDSSESILRLRPVTFRYKAHAGQEKSLQFGLIAEEVDEIAPELVVRSLDGEVETVQYNQLPAMLLNELQKAVRRIGELEREVRTLKGIAAK